MHTAPVYFNLNYILCFIHIVCQVRVSKNYNLNVDTSSELFNVFYCAIIGWLLCLWQLTMNTYPLKTASAC